jgi:uncharacterized FlaG/YvyC family protein
MTEEEISSTGQFAAVSGVDVAPSYQSVNTAAHPSATSTPTAPTSAQSAATASAAKPAKPPTSQAIASALAAANSNLAASNRQLDFRVDAATGISIALIRDSQTGVVLQQIPGADILALARMLADWSPGKHMLLDLIA